MQKSSVNNVNPFFQYVSNNKPAASSQINKSPAIESPALKYQRTNQNNSNQRKNSDSLNDPRKMNSNYLHRINETQNHSKSGTTKTVSEKNDIKQRRSRSRQKNHLKKRQNSDEQDKNETKQEHYHKTKLCPLYDKSQCKKGSQCNFAHGEKQLRGLPNFVKTRLCIAFKNGQCKNSSNQCKYAHGEEELRSLKHYGNSSDNLSKQYGYKNKYRQDKFNKYRRDSQSVHKKDKHYRKSRSKQQSKDKKRQSNKNSEREEFYKKNLPLSKEYEKFLYGQTELKGPQFNNSSYMIPSTAPPSKNTIYSDPHYMDSYSINLGYQTGKSSVVAPPSHIPPSHVPVAGYQTFIDKDYNKHKELDYTYRPQNKKYRYQKHSREDNFYQKEQKNYKQFPHQKSYYPPPPNDHYYSQKGITPYYSNQPEPFFQPQKEYNNNSYKPGFPQEAYPSQFNQGFFQKDVNSNNFSKQKNKNFFIKDSQISQLQTYGSSQRNVPPGFVGQYAQKEVPFYKNDNLNNSNYRKHPHEGLRNFSNQKNPYLNNGSFNEPYNGSFNGSLDLYPALDNSVNQSSRYPKKFQNGRYQNFSNNSNR